MWNLVHPLQLHELPQSIFYANFDWMGHYNFCRLSSSFRLWAHFRASNGEELRYYVWHSSCTYAWYGYYVQNTLNSPPLLLICLVYFSSVGRFSMFCLPFMCVYFVSIPKFFLVLFVASQYHGWVFPSLLDLQQKLSIHVSVYTDLYPFLGVVKVSWEVIHLTRHLTFSVTRQISKPYRISRDEYVVQVLYNPWKIYNVITYMCRS